MTETTETPVPPCGVEFEPGCVATDAELRAAVADGARLLDRKHPGWAEQLDLSCLRLEYLSHCVLGQLYGDFEHGECDLHEAVGGHWPADFAVRFGFDVPDEGHQEVDCLTDPWYVPRNQYAVLNDAWVREVTVRRYRETDRRYRAIVRELSRNLADDEEGYHGA